MRTLSLIALLSAMSSPAFAQDAPAGAQATGCEVSAFEAVRSERTGEILYWNNTTCSDARSSSDEGMMMGNGMMMSDGMMGDGRMGESMMSDSMMSER